MTSVWSACLFPKYLCMLLFYSFDVMLTIICNSGNKPFFFMGLVNSPSKTLGFSSRSFPWSFLKYFQQNSITDQLQLQSNIYNVSFTSSVHYQYVVMIRLCSFYLASYHFQAFVSASVAFCDGKYICKGEFLKLRWPVAWFIAVKFLLLFSNNMLTSVLQTNVSILHYKLNITNLCNI